MSDAVIDAIGLCAPLFFLFAYARVSLGHWQAQSMRFQVLNLLGVMAIMVSLSKDFNLPIFILEICWGVISVIGMWKARRAGN